MKYLLDTCTISEPTRKQPSPTVIKWLDAQDEATLFLSVLTIGELYQGIHKLPTDQLLRKTRLQKWIEHDLKQRFKNRILPLDLARVGWSERSELQHLLGVTVGVRFAHSNLRAQSNLRGLRFAQSNLRGLYRDPPTSTT